jgi:hypothetical protein
MLYASHLLALLRQVNSEWQALTTSIHIKSCHIYKSKTTKSAEYKGAANLQFEYLQNQAGFDYFLRPIRRITALPTKLALFTYTAFTGYKHFIRTNGQVQGMCTNNTVCIPA